MECKNNKVLKEHSNINIQEMIGSNNWNEKKMPEKSIILGKSTLSRLLDKSNK